MSNDRRTFALILIGSFLADADYELNYQQDALREARAHLERNEIHKAISVLGDACDHAFRDGCTETRLEADVCKGVFDLLTIKIGGAA